MTRHDKGRRMGGAFFSLSYLLTMFIKGRLVGSDELQWFLGLFHDQESRLESIIRILLLRWTVIVHQSV